MSSNAQSIAREVGATYRVDPGTLVIGTNVRTDTHPAAKEFAASIKARGVLEPVTVWAEDDGTLVVYRGQRRTLAAVKVGTPDGLVPVHVVAKPADADRITDQLTENVHRAAMRPAEERDAIEQLALLGVSAAQIAKRTALPRPAIDAALVVAANEGARARMDEGALTLEQAAIFAEFDGDARAVEQLEQSLSWGRSLEHTAQRLRDDAAEAVVLAVEADRLREEGVPVLDPSEVPSGLYGLRLENLVTSAGEEVERETWASIPGAAVVLSTEFAYDDEDDEQDTDDEGKGEGDENELRTVIAQTWICVDPAAAGLRPRWGGHSPTTTAAPNEGDAQAQADAKALERRTVLANNKAWRSAQVVRREWLTGFITRKAVPSGAEALICEAVLTGAHSLDKAFSERHPLLRTLLGQPDEAGYAGGADTCARLAAAATTPKAATIRTLAAVIAAWEASTDVHTWRNPTAWDARILTALTGWGYQPSEVEQLLTPTQPDTDSAAGGATDAA